MNRQRASYYLAGMIALVTLVVYLPALNNDFVNWDDNIYVYENIQIRSLNPAFFKWAFTDLSIAYWHPLSLVSHALDYAVWGLNPMGHHLTSILIHAANTFLVVVLIIRLLEAAQSSAVFGNNRNKDRDVSHGDTLLNDRSIIITSGIVGLLFGLHPLHVESVAWVAERKDVLYGFFALLCILAYARYAGALAKSSPPSVARMATWTAVVSATERSWNRQFLLVLFLFILALSSKAMAVTLPLILLILDWFPLRRIRSSKQFASVAIEKIPFLLLSLVASFITYRAQQGTGAMVSYESIPLDYRVPIAFKSLMLYLYKMAFPVDLLPFYPYPDSVSVLSPAYIGALLLTVGITALCLYTARKQPLWLAAWGFYVFSLIPVLGIVQVSESSMADRFTYLPSLGPFLIFGLAGAKLWMKADFPGAWGRMAKRSSVIAAVLLCSAMGYATVEQIAVWKTSTDLWSYIIEKGSRRVPLPAAMSVPHNNLGMAYLGQRRLDEALHEFETSLKLKPERAEPHNNIGLIYADQNRIADAIQAYQTALRIAPNYPTAHNNLGNAYLLQDRIEEAMQEYNTVLELQPDYAAAHYNLGNIYLKSGLLNEAMNKYKAAIMLNPDEPDVHNNLGLVYLAQDRLNEAMYEFSTALHLNPDLATARQNLEKCSLQMKARVKQ